MVQQDSVTVVVNGRPLPVHATAVHTTALDWLRAHGLTGAKEGCAEGECGACSILVARPGIDTPSEWVALNSCLVPVAALDGQELVTAEGLGTSRHLHPVQREMAVRGGSQCGYCTPGMIMASVSLLEENPNPNEEEIREALEGNYCRCTGYENIIKAVQQAAGQTS